MTTVAPVSAPVDGRATGATRGAPLLVLQRTRGWSALRLGELWRARDLLLSLADRDIKIRYRQTALGVSWVVLQPLITTAVLTFAFGRVSNNKGVPGVPFLVFIFVSMLIWNNFQLTFLRMSSSLTAARDLVAKVYFPRIVLPLATVAGAVIDFVVGLVVLAALLVLYGVAPPVQILLLPFVFALGLALATGIGLIGSSLDVRFRDIGLIMPVLSTFTLFGSPVAYQMSKVPESFQTAIWLNPLSGVLETARWAALSGPLPPGRWLAYSISACLGLLVVAMFVFKRLERGFADAI